MLSFIVTGCNGYIGSHMCYELKKAYPYCYILGVDKTDKPYLRHLYDAYSPIDISHAPLYSAKGSFDCIFHFAAYSSVEEGEREAWSYYRNNLGATVGAIDAAKRYGVKNFIFSSTAAVYGESANPIVTLKENTKPQPISVYGKSKLMCEQLLECLDINVARLRYFNACGRNVEAGLYEEHDPETHLIPLLARNKEATIFGNDWPTKDGTCVRDYVHVKDICRAHTLAYRYMEENNKSVLFNVGCGKGYSVKEVVDKANQILHNGDMTVEIAERRDGDVPYLVADTSRIKSTIDFDPQYSLDDIIESMKNG